MDIGEGILVLNIIIKFRKRSDQNNLTKRREGMPLAWCTDISTDVQE